VQQNQFVLLLFTFQTVVFFDLIKSFTKIMSEQRMFQNNPYRGCQ